jgi:hypothetical protein
MVSGQGLSTPSGSNARRKSAMRNVIRLAGGLFAYNVANGLTNHVFVERLSHFGPAFGASKPSGF